MAAFKDRTYIIGRERRQQEVPTAHERRSSNSARSQRYLPVPHRSVSRRHAELIVLDGTLYLRDLGSKNGTYVVDNGRKKRITEGYVKPEQKVVFGDCVRQLGELVRAHQAAEAQPGTAAGRRRSDK